MPSLANIPDDLLNPAEPELFIVWTTALPGDISVKRELIHLSEAQTGARIPERLRRAVEMEDRRRNG